MNVRILMAAVLIISAASAKAETPAAHLAQKAMPFVGAKAVDESRLQKITGREDLSQTVNARNSSNVSNNSVGDHTSTGAVSFDGQAFQGMRGLSVVSANSGNNVSINSSMNVNVAIRQ